MAAVEGPAPERKVFAVAAITRRLSARIEEFPAFWVEGEIAELRRQDGWGMVFWKLKDLDGSASIETQMVRAHYDRLANPLADGQRVIVLGRLQAFAKNGKVTLRALEVEPAGIGSLLAQLERLKAKLQAEGLFAPERKRPLPAFPNLIGLVCGRDAAAKHDVLENTRRRYPPARFLVRECAVQGPTAPTQLIRAIQELDADEAVDVIVLARGGGSVEDLAAFSDEDLCRVIAACGTPIVSAIGHEQDSPLSDHVADVRASTPTHATRLIVPDAAQLLADLDALVMRARRSLTARITRERESLTARLAHPVLARPDGFLDVRRASLEALRGRLAAVADRRLEREHGTLQAAAAQLRALGPGATLERGYAIALDADGHVITAATDVAAGAAVAIRLSRGSLATRVEEVRP
jgi:exodeoxyribonuclease VII large subunit